VRNLILMCILLIVTILAVYWQVGTHEFVSYDDSAYVTENSNVAGGITGNNIVWAFTSVYKANWHPITWLSHMADVQIYGMNPRGHHLTNVGIHIVSSLLLLLFLLRCTGSLWQSSFVAALFALHPMHVESVAWVAERKDVLSAFFGFLTLFLYSEYAKKPGAEIFSSLISHPSTSLPSPLYLLSLFSLMLGLMSKQMLVTIPVVMLLMDYWPLDRYRHEEQEQGLRQLFSRAITLIKEKIPFFACSLVSGIVTIYAQHTGGATKSLKEIPYLLRIENALIAYLKYIIKALLPHDLAVLYPLSASFPLWQVIGSLLILLLVSAAVIRFGRRYPYLPIGWFWFLVTLLPVIGLIQVGAQSMADRYSYIPLTGLFIIAAWGVSDLAKGLQYRQAILALLAGAVIIASTALTWQQIGYWRDTISLYRHTLEVTTGNVIISDNLGSELQKKGDLDGAIQLHREAIRINPDFPNAHYNLGIALAGKGQLDGALQAFKDTLRLSPNDSNVYYNLGFVLLKKGDLNGAIQGFQETLRINPNDNDAKDNLGLALAQKRLQDAAR
jgi:tetratricopeptide (TPR) repeat protein